MTRVLVVNAGSSTLKLRVLAADDAVARDVLVDEWDGAVDERIVEQFRAAGRVDAVGHRVVHGAGISEATVIDDDVMEKLASITDLAPLHQPRALAAIAAARVAAPDVPHVACFDTAFHAGMPVAARTYALPASWRERWGLRRYGFHGLSHAWVARRAPEIAGAEGPRLRLVSCHLGAGASACAVVDGRSVDTTMGFTPLEGLVMATRSGSVDPGLLVWLLRTERVGIEALARGLEHEGGLAALSGTGGDMRTVLARRRVADGDAALAFDVYVHCLRQAIAAMAAAAGGLDVLAFTGGVGEHAPEVRAAAVATLGFLGLAVDDAANRRISADGDISSAAAVVKTVVVSAREDLEIARQVRSTCSSA